MKRFNLTIRRFLFVSWMALPFLTLQGQNDAFDSGSTGTDGAISIATNTVMTLPSSGVFNATTVSVAEGATLSFTRNDFNTPVFLLATGNVVISGTISVNGGTGSRVVGGDPGPGGFAGGTPGSSGSSPGDGRGPGGGLSGSNVSNSTSGVGSGSYGHVGTNSTSTRKGATYGSPLLIPMIGGSGGGGTTGTPGYGGGGGGAILIASNTEIIVNSVGKITANGGKHQHNGYNGGSGGAIRLIAPKVSGAGKLQAYPLDNSGNRSINRAGRGRIRIDSLDKSAMFFTFDPLELASVGSNMVVFPSPTPRLDIILAAGTTIAVGFGSPASIILPFNTDPNQTITVRATNFDTIVDIDLVLQPENGSRIVYPDTIDNSAGGFTDKIINVVLPVNVLTKVFVWTR